MDEIKSLLQNGQIKEALTKFRKLSEEEQEDFFRSLAPHMFPPQIFGVLFRKLHPEKTYEDFYKAWLPPLKEGQKLDHYFPAPTYVLAGENISDPSDIITIGLMWIDESKIDDLLSQTKETEQLRHDKIDSVAEKTQPTLIYRFKDVTKLGS